MNVLFDILHFFLSSGDPGHPPDGTIWYNRALAKFRKRENGATSDLAAMIPGGSDTQVQVNNAGAFGTSGNFTYNISTNDFQFGVAGASIVAVGAMSMAIESAALTLTCSNMVLESTVGGVINIGYITGGPGVAITADDSNARIVLSARRPVIGNTSGDGFYLWNPNTSTYWQYVPNIAGALIPTDTGSASLP